MIINVPLTHHLLPAYRTQLQEAGLPTADLTSVDLTHFQLLFDETELVGGGGWEKAGGNGLLRSIVVIPSRQREGLARRLVEQLETDAAAAGICCFYLLTETAGTIFDRLGYKTIPRTEAPAPLQQTTQFAALCPDSALCMMKQLPTSK